MADESLIFAKEPCVLHLLAGSPNLQALDAVKNLLDNGTHVVNEREPTDNLSPLHISAAWDNLAMCQLLVHYGADLDALDIDRRRPIDLACGKSLKFLKKLRSRQNRHSLKRFIGFLFSSKEKPQKNVRVGSNSKRSSMNVWRQSNVSCPALLQSLSLNSFLPTQINSTMESTQNPAPKTSASETASSNYHTALSNEPINLFAEPSIYGKKLEAARLDLIQNSRISKLKFSEEEFNTSQKDLYSRLPTKSNSIILSTMKQEGNFESPKMISNAKSTAMVTIRKTPRTPNPSQKDLYPRLPAKPDSIILSPMKREGNFESPKMISNVLNTKSTAMVTIRKTPRTPNPLPKSQFKLIKPQNACAIVDLNDIAEEDKACSLKAQSPEEIKLCEQFSKLSTKELRTTLEKEKCPMGPINTSNRYIYERKLARNYLKKLSGDVESKIRYYSLPLQRVIEDDENKTNNTKHIGEKEERIICQTNFIGPDANRNEVDFFCYLLIDSSMIDVDNIDNCTLRNFIDAIFYVGKGRKGRPIQHLIDAYRARSNGLGESAAKLKRINQIWDNKDGVISLAISQNIPNYEALIREGAMIDALRIENLTNIRRGNFSRLNPMWTDVQIASFGAKMLYRAYNIFRNERCRPIYEMDAKNFKDQNTKFQTEKY